MSRPLVRILVDRLIGALIVTSVMVAAIPVLILLLFVVIKGLPGLLTPGFFTDPPFPQGVPGGGVLNAIIGTLEIVGIGSLLAVPIGSLIGIFLSEYGRNQIGDAVRFISDVLTGLPSIAFGIFGYTVVVLTTHHFSAISASIALGVLMLPVILRATESALVLVPQSLREAGLALGAPRWRVTLEIVVPAALGGIVTGALLAMARAAGETAPLLFTAFGNDIVQVNLIQPMGALALTVFRNALVPYGRATVEVLLDGDNVLSPDTDVIQLRRQVGMLFQRPNPFPKSIFDNVAYGPHMLGWSKPRINQVVEDSLKDTGLWDEVKTRLNRSALNLSGGQQQRLCLARALAVEPQVILMDEPASALDPIATLRIEELMQDLKQRYTIVIVTHNMQQAARVSDFTAFMLMNEKRAGEVIEYGPTDDIFNRPKDSRTEDYITGRFG